MKRLLFIVLAASLLVACGNEKVHKNIRQEMATDTEQIIEIFDKAIVGAEDGELYLTGEDEHVIEQYLDKYNALKNSASLNSGGLTEEERTLLTSVGILIKLQDSYERELPDRSKFDDTKDITRNVIKTGKISDE